MGLLTDIRFSVQRMRNAAGLCAHTSWINEVEPNSDVCDQCVSLGDTWVHLRTCMTCGQVGCCDSSKNKHAHRHADQTGHPIVRSIEPGEDWAWCFVDQTLVQVSAPGSEQ